MEAAFVYNGFRLLVRYAWKTRGNDMRKQAIDFFGGHAAIKRAWKETLKRELGKMTGDELFAIQVNLFPADTNIVTDILAGTREICTSLFEKLSCSLDVSPVQAMAYADDMTQDEVGYWKDKMEKAGAIVAGAADSPNGFVPELSLEMFILLTALDEMDEQQEAVNKAV